MQSGSAVSTSDDDASHIPLVSGLPDSLIRERWNDIAILRRARPQKRNAHSEMVFGIEQFYSAIPQTIKAAVLDNEGDHICAGLDLNEIRS